MARLFIQAVRLPSDPIRASFPTDWRMAIQRGFEIVLRPDDNVPFCPE